MRTTQVILLKNIPKLGNKGEIKNLKSGYVRNFLLPFKKVIIATPKNLKVAKKLQEQTDLEAGRQEKIAAKQSLQLEGSSFKIYCPANQEDQLYAAVSEKQLASIILEKSKIELKPEQLELPETVKKLGDYKILVDFGFDKKAKIDLEVIKEKKE